MLPTSHTFQQAKFLKPGKIVFYTIFCNIRKVLAYLLSGYTFGCSFKNNSIAYCCSVSFWVVFWSLWLVALFGYSSLKMSIYQKHHSGIQVWRSHILIHSIPRSHASISPAQKNILAILGV